ncbi:Uncharacterised protein [Mycobacteroides abscessus subsp. abscessus]|nr:Uncharacterised protein [Mycobacteroides abscessus subsp. abscessus]
MKLTLTVARDGDLWVVEDRRSGKWWTAHQRADGTYFVMNHLGRPLRQGAALYLQITKAVECKGGSQS